MGLHQMTIDGKSATVVFMTAYPGGQVVEPEEAKIAIARFDDGGIAYYMFDEGEPRTLVAVPTLDAVAKSHETKFSVAFRYAFARARKAIRNAAPGSSPTVITARYEAAMVEALDSVLPKMLHKVAAEGGQVGLDLLEKQLKVAASHKYGSTQVQLPMDVAAQMAAFPIAEEDLTGDGRELDSHITVKYGLLDVASNEVSAALADEKPAEATLGKTSVFEGVENGTADAVIIEVSSDCLHRWNKKIEDAVETAESKYDYKPHATIAYVKPGLGKKYAGDSRFEGMKLVFDRIVLTSKDDQRVSLPVDGILKAAGGPGSGRYPKGSGQNPQSGKRAIGFDQDPWKAYPDAPVPAEVTERWVEKVKDGLRSRDRLNSDGTVSLFHSTASETDSIMEHGLVPGHSAPSGQDWIPDQASYGTFFYGQKDNADRDIETEGVAVIEARIPINAMTLRRMVPDTEVGLTLDDGLTELVSGSTVVFIGGVPASALSVYAEYNPDFAYKPRGAADFWMKFDMLNPSVIEWARKHAAELIADITGTTRRRIRIAVEELQETGDWDFAHDRIMAAVGDEARADLIARHETMLAANEGQRLGWDQAKDAGLLSGTERREWIITGDERTCPICMTLDGKTALLNGTYPGDFAGPPAHVQCRCTEGIIG